MRCTSRTGEVPGATVPPDDIDSAQARGSDVAPGRRRHDPSDRAARRQVAERREGAGDVGLVVVHVHRQTHPSVPGPYEDASVTERALDLQGAVTGEHDVP